MLLVEPELGIEERLTLGVELVEARATVVVRDGEAGGFAPPDVARDVGGLEAHSGA